MRALLSFALLPLAFGLLAACSTPGPDDAASGGTAPRQAEGPVQTPTDLGVEAEKEEARIRAGGSATSQSR